MQVILKNTKKYISILYIFTLFYLFSQGNSSSIYVKTNEIVEKWSTNSLSFMLKVVVPLYTLPIIATSFLKYYKSGHSSDSFRRIYPAM